MLQRYNYRKKSPEKVEYSHSPSLSPINRKLQNLDKSINYSDFFDAETNS